MKLSLFALAVALLAGCSSPTDPSPPAGDVTDARPPYVADAGAQDADASDADATADVCTPERVHCDCLPSGELVPVTHDDVCSPLVAAAVCDGIQARGEILCPQPLDGGP